MKERRRRKRGWLGKCLFGAAVGLCHPDIPLHAQEPETLPVLRIQTTADAPVPVSAPAGPQIDYANPNAGPTFSCAEGDSCCCAPTWCDPISRVPNFFGDFFARGSQACRTITNNQPLVYTGGGEGFTSIKAGTVVFFPAPPAFSMSPLSGPGGPYTLSTNVTGTGAGPTFVADQNAELTNLIHLTFPGASFVDGVLTSTGDGDRNGTILFNYLLSTNQTVCVNLPNPSGGGLVGRNQYFENGAALPQDRVYFFYNNVNGYPGLGSHFDINRYVFGGEKTFFNGRASLEVRIPFAGTANSDQVGGQALAVGNTEFGNIGLALKAAVIRTPNFVTTVGLGLSAPTADDSRMFLGNQSVIEIQNRAWLLQPLFGMAWAPNDRFYAQGGLQFDIDPTGNPVLMRDANNQLVRAGTLRDQAYVYAGGALGYWLYQNDCRRLTGVALQGELHYSSSFGTHNVVQNGPIEVSDIGNNLSVLNATAGLQFELGRNAYFGLGFSFPLTSERLYDWNLVAQLNYKFGYQQR